MAHEIVAPEIVALEIVALEIRSRFKTRRQFGRRTGGTADVRNSRLRQSGIGRTSGGSSQAFVVTPESIIPHLTVLQEYKPLIRQQFSKGLFGPLDERYFNLIDRSADMANEVDWGQLDRKSVFGRFQAIFNSERNVRKEAYFDSMTHFDFKCLLPALLQVEDRMSMAHGLESRVPLLDHAIVEFAASIPADIKFKGGQMKHFVKQTFAADLPQELTERRDKMGFPVPLKEWFEGDLKSLVGDTFVTQKNRHSPG